MKPKVKQRLRCSNAENYMALRPPTCGCLMCEANWKVWGKKSKK